MKTITQTINLYTIDELKSINPEIYKKVIDDKRTDIIDFRFSDAEYDIKDILKTDYKINNIDDIYYSISYCQGDGFCFTGSNILSYTRIKNNSDDCNAFERWIVDNITGDELVDLLEYLNCNYNLKIIKTNHLYCHPYTCNIDYEYFYSSDDPVALDRINDIINKICGLLFDNVYVEICHKIEKYLYSYYDVDDDEVVEYLQDNDFYFTDKGVIY